LTAERHQLQGYSQQWTSSKARVNSSYVLLSYFTTFFLFCLPFRFLTAPSSLALLETFFSHLFLHTFCWQCKNRLLRIKHDVSIFSLLSRTSTALVVFSGIRRVQDEQIRRGVFLALHGSASSHSAP